MDSDARILIGLMSGTSADGVDAAAVRVVGRGRAMSAQLLQHTHVPYNDELRQRIFTLRGAGHGSFAEYASVCRALTLVHVEATKACSASAGLMPNEVAALAVHGQTFFHEPPSTIQLFDPALLAWETGVQVISDFRRADLAAGGQGAPLVPFADWLLFRHETKHRILLNLGGIANLTYLPPGCDLDDAIAFDCGPANCLSDHIMRQSDQGTHDPGGELALTGTADASVVAAFLASEFVQRPIPKSTDTAEMLAAFEQVAPSGMPIADRLATANVVVASAIASALDQLLPRSGAAQPPESTGTRAAAAHRYAGETQIIAAGGGVENQSIMHHLAATTGLPITTTQDHGIAADAKEAVAFALLGAATLDGEPSNVPSATGASRGVVLGAITPRPF